MITNKIITFKSDTKERKGLFKAASFAHPAKMVLGLQIYLIEHYTKPGDTILDPMAGSGTLLMACTLGRNVVLIELEDKFVKMQQDNWDKIKSLGPMLGFTMGKAVILQGDSRHLEGLLADNILFSPPYAEINQMPRENPDPTADKQGRANIGKQYSDNQDNIGNLPYGEVSAVISSPPYEGTITGKELPESEKKIERKSGKDKWGKHLRLGQSQLTKYADAILTSPPYEESVTGENGIDWTKLKTKKGIFRDRTKEPAFQRYAMDNFQYSKQKQNIGNLKSENYLEAMIQVYRQCYKVLKDKGIMVLVTKNFIRDKKVIRLDLDTIKLCESAGFKLKDILKRKLTSQSFWRIIYHNKYPDVEKIEFEEILVFEKETQ
jgi:DNA modification methylase